ncbi:MAG: MFS transporter [Chloroflexota bacterium]
MATAKPPAKTGKTIPIQVYLLGMVSFFNDISSEMLYPIMPIFLTGVLHAPVFVIGIIDGVAEGISALFKAYFGFLSDKLQKRKPFVVVGYGTSAFAKIIFALAYNWPLVFVGRVLDRLGKGVRTGARDALLLDAADDNNKGLIFGIHRSMDSAGAVVGPLVALGLLQLSNDEVRPILYAAAIPGFIGLFFFLFVKEAKKRVQITKTSLRLSLKELPPNFRLFLLTFGLFSLGNSSDSFLILQSQQLGLSITAVVLAYVVYNLVYTLLSTPAGIIADKLGAKKVFLVGLLIYVGVYLCFAFNGNGTLVWVLFAVYGSYIALTDGVSKALVGNYIPKEKGAIAYGTLQAVTSLASLSASVIAGVLWSAIAPAAAFIFGATCALAAFILFVVSGLSKSQA